MLNKNNYSALIRSLICGDQSSFEEIYNLYKRPLYSIALRYLKDEQLAEDALQEVFVKLWQNRQEIDEQRSLKSFLLVCMKNHVLNVIRAEQARIKAAILAHEPQEALSTQTESGIAFNELRGHLHTSLSALPVGKRKIAHLSLIEGYTNQEIATTLHISEHTVRSQLSQAKKFIRHFLGRTMVSIVLLLI